MAESSLTDSSPGRIVGVLVKPVETFRSIAQRPTWAVALVVLLVATGVNGFVLLNRVDRDAFREQMRARIARQGREATEQQLDLTEKLTFSAGPFFGILFTLVLYFVGAGILMAMNVVGGELRYKTSLAVLVHAIVPYALLALLAIPVALARESITLEEVQGGRLVPTNLAFFAPEDAGRRLVALLSSIDLFNVWVIALMIVGYAIAARVSKGAAAGVVIGLWVVLVLIKVGFAGFGGG
jgi:Yip1-like protein